MGWGIFLEGQPCLTSQTWGLGACREWGVEREEAQGQLPGREILEKGLSLDSTLTAPSGNCSLTRKLRSRTRGAVGREVVRETRRREGAVEVSTLSQEQLRTYKVLVTAPLLRLAFPD